MLLKVFDLEARFPTHAGGLPQADVDYVAGQVKLVPGALVIAEAFTERVHGASGLRGRDDRASPKRVAP